MKYKLTSRREEAVTIDGLGVLPAATREGKTEDSPGTIVPSVTIADEVQAAAFAAQRGVTLSSALLPTGVELMILVGESASASENAEGVE